MNYFRTNYPRKSYTLNDLATFFSISLDYRLPHASLIDTELLAKVMIAVVNDSVKRKNNLEKLRKFVGETMGGSSGNLFQGISVQTDEPKKNDEPLAVQNSNAPGAIPTTSNDSNTTTITPAHTQNHWKHNFP